MGGWHGIGLSCKFRCGEGAIFTACTKLGIVNINKCGSFEKCRYYCKKRYKIESAQQLQIEKERL